MSSRIEPGPAPKPGTAPQAKPDAPKAPAAARPAGTPPQAGKPPAKTVAGQTRDADDRGESRGAAGWLKAAPAWAISMLVHVIALLAMALMGTPPPEQEEIRVITSSTAEPDQEFEEFAEDVPEDQPEATTEQADVTEAFTADVPVVTDVQVASTADDVEAAPMAVELTDFGSQSTAAADMMSSIGAVGGTGGGLGLRSNAAAVAAKEGGGADTEQAVDRALKWFIAHQMPDGGWSFRFEECPGCNGACKHSGKYGDRAGATAMALLPFLGRGYTHKEGPYKTQIERGLAYLAARAVQQNGIVYDPKYSHSLYVQGLAGIVLSESYGMTQDERIGRPAQMVLNHIMAAQDPRGGGWRYKPGQPGDTSAVGWQIMALKSGHMGSLQINPKTILGAVAFLDSVQADGGATYGYSDGSSPTAARTAVGLLCRMYLGWKKDHPALQEGVKRLAARGPTTDLYYDYYATQIMHHMEGDVWLAWNSKMKSMLLSTQAKQDAGHAAGSWFEGVEGGPHSSDYGGRIYCTSLATLILEVYYRHLPIYRNQSVEAEFQE